MSDSTASNQANAADAPPAVTSPLVGDELSQLLPETAGQIGLVAALLNEGITDRHEIVERGAAANTGAVYNLIVNIKAIREGEIPTAPAMANGARSSARSFLKQHRSKLSPAAISHLEHVISQLAPTATLYCPDCLPARRALQRRTESRQQQRCSLTMSLGANAAGAYPADDTPPSSSPATDDHHGSRHANPTTPRDSYDRRQVCSE